MAATASATLQNLETRLRRLEHYLDPAPTQGSGDDRQTPDVEAVQSRLRKLESQTADALGSNQHIQALAQLYQDHPELSTSEHDTATASKEALEAKLPIVLSSAAAYPKMVSSLTTLQQYPISDSKELNTLITLSPRLDRFEAVQTAQLQQIHDLRHRSTNLAANWYERHVLESSDQWASWEERMMHVEQCVRRKETARAREENDT